MSSAMDFTALTDRLTRDAARATAARLYFSNRGVRRWLSRILANDPGEEHSFLADPLFEAMFGWKGSGKHWQDLQEELLSPETINALDYKQSSHRIDRTWSVYTHQLQALKTLLQPEARSLVVSSGTGSGKTECFLVPILESMVRQVKEHNQPIEGVQALFLYPLNALINSQQERLSAWMSPFEGKIRYCLYNGETKQKAREDTPERVLSRVRLRESPPPVLLTNATMLEYMLVRSEDNPILEKSRRQLQWIVLDEAHTYIGSQAAELALLLRRVMIGFGVEPANVRFVATSATIGSGDEEGKNQLREFLADLAGVSVEQVVVALGEREVPLLPTPEPTSDNNPVDLQNLSSLPADQLYNRLTQSPFATTVRNRLAKTPSTIGELQLATVDRFNNRKTRRWLEFLAQCSRAVSTAGTPFLPLRIHLLHRTFDGLWACINGNCPGKPAEIADDPEWRWGSVHTHAVETCPHCESLTLELVRCSECGNEHLKCEQQFNRDTGQIRLMPRKDRQPLDDFTLDLASDQWESAGLDTANEVETDSTNTSVEAPFGANPAYLPARYTATATIQQLPIDNAGRQSEDAEQRDLLLPNPEFRCALCNSGVTPRRPEPFLFRSARAGMPFYSLIAGRNLLRSSPAPHELNDRIKEALPADGRKILTFSDSRQGTARLSMSQQQDADRSFVRSQIYHQLAQESTTGVDKSKEGKLRQDIESLASAATDNEAIQEMRQRFIDELNTLTTTEASLPWQTIKARIATNRQLVNGSRRYMNRVSTLPTISDTDYANFCLYREFIRRPKKGSTLETLGLVALRYTAIESISMVPPDVATRDITLQEWKTLLTLMVNFVFRAGYAVDMPHDWERWLGERLRTNTVLGPNQDRVRGTIGWPSAQYPRSTIVKLLQKSLQLDLDLEVDKQWLTNLLQSAWTAIATATPRLINNTGEGWQLQLADCTELYTPANVWQCPFTGRAFDRVFRNTSPYIPSQINAIGHTCNQLTMPAIPHPFWVSATTEPAPDAEQWLESDETVVAVRDSLLWENHSDLVARNSEWYGTGEHSAQQDSRTLQTLTDDFNAGRINILNCSTTMEMGVDIAGISAVMMNNAPPGPANYLQRAGRAGRRRETSAAALTICSANAHGAMFFANPQWPFKTSITVPRVTLESVDIVQRHVNALLLTHFMKPIANSLGAKCGWFFCSEGNDESYCDNFIAWLDSGVHTELQQALDRLTRRTVLASQPQTIILSEARKRITSIMQSWLNVVDLLEMDLTLLTSDRSASSQSPAAKAVEFRLERIRGEYLLHELANQGFLPSYGFPTDVVSFVTTTIEELQQRINRKEDRIDNRTKSRGYPSRDLPVAIREYAPGADVAIDGRVYTSGGVLLNWHLPPGDSTSREIQALKHYWSCRTCGAGGTTVQTPPEQCPSCGSLDPTTKRFIEPAGFAVELTYRTHNDTTRMQYMPVFAPRLHINDASWSQLATPAAGRMRFSSEGIILYRNPGRNNCGYSICLRCGRADEQTQPGEIASKFHKTHIRLRGGKDTDGDSTCEASHEDRLIIFDHELAHESRTSIAELQLNHPANGAPVADPIVAWSIAVAMRHGLVQKLGLESSEIGIAIQEVSSEGGLPMQSIFLYDTASGGAGYAEQLMHNLPEIAQRAYTLLQCRCDTCCHNCLLSYDTQHEVANLNRTVALEFLDSGFLQMLKLPHEYRYFGENSLSENQPIARALASAINKVDCNQIDIYLQGSSEIWNLAEWPFLQNLIRFASNEGIVRIIIPGSVLTELPDSQLRIISGLRYTRGLELFSLDELPNLQGDGSLLAVCHTVNGKTAWAAAGGTTLAPAQHWSDIDTVVVRASTKIDTNDVLMPIDQTKFDDTSDTIPPGSLRLGISNELDVAIEDFGETLWALIFASAPALRKQMEGKGAVEKITYTDQYIHSPLCLRLLAELVVATPEQLISTTTQFDINTVTLEDHRNCNRTPNRFHDNWNLDRHRRAVAPQLLAQMGWTGGAVDVLERTKAPHYRELRLHWPDASDWSIQLDHGFGPWKTAGITSFPFDQGIPRQASIAATLKTNLITRNPQFETYLFFDNAPGSD